MRFRPTVQWSATGALADRLTVRIPQRFEFDPDATNPDLRGQSAGDVVSDSIAVCKRGADSQKLAKECGGLLFPDNISTALGALGLAPKALLSQEVADNLSSDGRLKAEGSVLAIAQGERRYWDSWHQTGRPAVVQPKGELHIDPFQCQTKCLPLASNPRLAGQPGCPECIHAHWSWGTTTNASCLSAGFGPLQRHLDDPDIEDMWINERLTAG